MEDQEQGQEQQVQDTPAPQSDDLNSILSDPARAKEYISSLQAQVKEANGQAKNLRHTKQSLEKEAKELRDYKAQQEALAEQSRLAKLETEQRLQEQLKAEQQKNQEQSGILARVQRQQLISGLVQSANIDPAKTAAAEAMLGQSDLSDPESAIKNLVTANPWLLKEKPVKEVPGNSGGHNQSQGGKPPSGNDTHNLSHLGVKRHEEKMPTAQELTDRRIQRGLSNGGSLGSMLYRR